MDTKPRQSYALRVGPGDPFILSPYLSTHLSLMGIN